MINWRIQIMDIKEEKLICAETCKNNVGGGYKPPR